MAFQYIEATPFDLVSMDLDDHVRSPHRERFLGPCQRIDLRALDIHFYEIGDEVFFRHCVDRRDVSVCLRADKKRFDLTPQAVSR